MQLVSQLEEDSPARLPELLFDVTTGANGSCAVTYLCVASTVDVLAAAARSVR